MDAGEAVIAQVSVTKNGDLIEFYQTPLMARVPKIRERRAADMVERFSKQYQGTVPMRQGGGESSSHPELVRR